MTADEIARDRTEMQAALADPSHPLHADVTLLVLVYAKGDIKTRAFLHAIAPYMFDADGSVIRAGQAGGEQVG